MRCAHFQVQLLRGYLINLQITLIVIFSVVSSLWNHQFEFKIWMHFFRKNTKVLGRFLTVGLPPKPPNELLNSLAFEVDKFHFLPEFFELMTCIGFLNYSLSASVHFVAASATFIG